MGARYQENHNKKMYQHKQTNKGKIHHKKKKKAK